jgi:hypothetical protein
VTTPGPGPTDGDYDRMAPGYPWPERDRHPGCGAVWIDPEDSEPYYYCTRPEHTAGQHVAADGLEVVATWTGDGADLREKS